jgi:hypothetical protein
MPDWDKFEKNADQIIKNASDKADKILASDISSITRLTDREILEFFPEPSDVEKLHKLIQIVKSADDRNSKINSIMLNSEKFGGIILTLLSKFV